ncbi:MAG: VOC family protein [Dehalococcoidia bacterium]
MVKPMHLGHTNIWVTNLARAEEFYAQGLGLEVVSRRENGVNLSAREHSQELVLREIGPEAREQAINSVGTNHLAWEMASFDDLQEMCQQITSRGIQLTRVRSNSYSVGVYFNDPDGNSNEAYFEDVEAFRRRPEEGEYHRKLEGIYV